MNPYTTTSACVERLYAEYLKHPRLIIATDYDSTLHDTHKLGHTYEATIALLKRCAALNFYLVIFTASDPERHEEIMLYATGLDLPIAAINKNPIALKYGNHGKIYYNLLLCDRAGLGQALDILDDLLDKIEGIRDNSLDSTGQSA